MIENIVKRLSELQARVARLEIQERVSGLVTTTHTHAKLVASDGSPDPALSAGADGALTAAVSLTLASGATVTEFSTDGTLAGNSDAAIPTEKAVKTYADARSPAPGCAFLAYSTSGQADIVGDGSPVSAQITFGTEVYDKGGDFASSTFTAPATGLYLLITQILVYDSGGNPHTNCYAQIVTSNRTYNTFFVYTNLGYTSQTVVAIADMDISDTATVYLQSDGANQTLGVLSGLSTRFCGMRVA